MSTTIEFYDFKFNFVPFNREWKLRHDIVDDDSKDTVSYTMRNKFIFRPDLSNGLTGDEIVTMPNLIIIGGLMAVKRDRAPMIPLVVKAMKKIFKDPKSPFINVRVMDILFDGVGFNCDGDDFSAKAVCAAIKSEGPERGVVVHNDTFVSHSILGGVSIKSYLWLTLGRQTPFSELLLWNVCSNLETTEKDINFKARVENVPKIPIEFE